MKRVIPLDLPFRGRRNYIHGTDLYEAIAATLLSEAPAAADAALQFSIHHFSTHAVDLVITDEATTDSSPEAGAAFRSGAGLYGWIVETEKPVANRVAFAEEDIASASVIEGDTARIVTATGYPPIDVLVILNKHWHDVSMPEAGKRWVFVKLELSRLLKREDADSIAIHIDQNLARRMTRAIVEAGGQRIGHIYFSKIDA